MIQFQTNFFFNGIIFNFYWTALHFAVESESAEIVEILLSNKEIDVNAQTTSQKHFFLIQFHIIFLYRLS